MSKKILKTSLGTIFFVLVLFLFSNSAQAHTWTQVNEDGFGDNNTTTVYSMVVFNDYLYASASNERLGVQIWRTNNGTNWTKVNENGFGDTNNASSHSMIVFDDYLYVGTSNSSDYAEIWRTNNGTSWSQVVGNEADGNDTGYNENGFGTYNSSVYSMAVFNDKLYVGTSGSGLEIYRTSNGTSWSPVVADAIDDNNDGSDEGGFGGYYNYIAYSMTTFNGYLYVGTEDNDYWSSYGTEIWRTNNGTSWNPVVANEVDSNDTGNNENGFGDTDNTVPYSMKVFNNYLYAGVYNYNGAELFRSSNGTSWDQIIGDEVDSNETGVDENGFGNDDSGAVYSMKVLNDNLYIGTYNYSGGAAQIRKSSNGTSGWNKINEDGFEDSDNIIASSMTAFHDQLYVGTSNSDSGTEIWGYLDSDDPSITNQSPASGARDVSFNSNIYFEANDSNSGINSSSIDVSISGSAAITNSTCQSGYSCTIESDGGKGYNVTVNPSGELSYNKEESITVNVSDYGGNLIESTWVFDTAVKYDPKILTTSGPGESARLQAYSRKGEAEGNIITGLFPATYTGGVGIVPIDQNNNGAQDQFLIFAINNGGPQARVMGLRADGSTVLKGQQFVFDSSIRDGLSATSGDFDNDGFQDDAAFCLTGDRAPIVRVYTDVTGVDNWKLAYEFRAPFGNVGCNLGTFQYDSDHEEILVASNHGPADPNVYIYWANGTLQKQFAAYGSGVQSGLTPSGIEDRIYTTPNNGSSQINGFDRTGERKSFWWAYQEHVRGDFKNVPGDVDLDGKDELLISPIGQNGPHVMAFEPTGKQRVWPNFFAFDDETLRNGVGIAVIDNWHGVN